MRGAALIIFLFLGIGAAVGEEGMETFKTSMQYKKGYHPFRLFGDQPIPEKGVHRSKVASSCSVCIDTSAAEAIDVKIKVGATLRYNLIKVFGYILHRTFMEFNTAYYTSLYFILTCIKLNHVDILSLVEVLDRIAFLGPNDQFQKLFEEMEKHLPSYLTCSATFWKNGIATKEVNLDRVLIPYGDNTLVVNLLEGITPEELKKIAGTKGLEGPPKNDAEKKIVYNFNINILHLVRFVQKHNKYTPHQWVAAGMLQFFPRSLIQPDLEESIQMMNQYLYENDIDGFKEVNIPISDREPYKMIKFLFDILTNSKTTVDIIKDAAQTILNNLKPRTPTAVNPNYVSFTYYIQPDFIKIDEMLNYVTYGAYPFEIRLAARRIQYYLQHKAIGYFDIMMNFNPYLYSTPTEVLIAILDRILRRQPDLSPEVLNSVGAVYSYLIFRYRYMSMPVVFPSDMVNMNVLIMGLKAPDIDKTLRKNLDILISMLVSDQIKFSKILEKEVPVYECSTPVICLIKLLTKIKDTTPAIVDEKQLRIIIVIIESCCKDGLCPIEEHPDDQILPLQLLYIWRPELNVSYELSEGNTLPPISTTTKSTTRATSTPPPVPTEGPVPTVSPSPSTTPSTPAPPPPAVNVTVPDGNWTEAPSEDIATVIIDILQKMEQKNDFNYTGSDKNIERIVNLLREEEYKSLLVNISVSHEMLITAFQTFLQTMGQTYQGDAQFKQWLVMFIGTIQNTANILANIGKDPKFEKPIPIKLMIALPLPKDAKERELYALLREVLSRQELFDSIYDNIKKDQEVNVGTYLKAVLAEEIKLTDKLSAKEMEAVKFYIDKVQTHGFGEVKIEYSISSSVLITEINISGCMSDALGFESLDRDGKLGFNNIIHYLSNNIEVLKRWDKWPFYPESGIFTNALFNYILRWSGLKMSIREAISLLQPKINYDGNGKNICVKGRKKQ